MIHGLLMDYKWIMNGLWIDYEWDLMDDSMDYEWIMNGLWMDYEWDLMKYESLWIHPYLLRKCAWRMI